MDPNTNLTSLLPFAAFSGIVGYLVSMLKPYLEKIPVMRPGTDLHDPTLRILSVILNIAAAVGYGFYSHALPSDLWPNFAIAGLLQAAGSEAYYKTVTRSGQSIGDSGLTSLPKNILARIAPPADAVVPQSGFPGASPDSANIVVPPTNGKSLSSVVSLPPETLAATDSGIKSYVDKPSDTAI
jgi:hypothetical protein